SDVCSSDLVRSVFAGRRRPAGRHRPRRRHRQLGFVMPRAAGFTLLELLIAIAIFGLVGMATYQMLTSVLRSDGATRLQEQRLRELVRAMAAFERDVRQVRARSIRAAYGDPQPALHGTDARSTGEVLTLTRGGWRNPTASDRSSLQQIGRAHV